MDIVVIAVALLIVLLLAVPLAAAVRVIVGHERSRGVIWDLRLSNGLPDLSPQELQYLRFVRWLRHRSHNSASHFRESA